MASTPGLEPGPHWWEASAHTTAPPLALLMLPPPKIKRTKVVLKSEMFGYLRIIDRRFYQSSDFLLNFSKVFVLLENPEFRNFLKVLY